MRIIAIIQARMSSERLPGKILKNLGGKPVLQNIVERVRKSEYIDEVVVATSTDKTDDTVEKMLIEKGIECYRGSLDNVLERFYKCSLKYKADIIIRLTADNALVDADIIDEAINIFRDNDVDYLDYKDTLPIGMGVEIFKFEALKKSFLEAEDQDCLEHVTPYMKLNESFFRVLNYSDPSDQDLSDLRFTMDTSDDYKFMSLIYDSFDNNMFSYYDVLELIKKNPLWKKINCKVIQRDIKYNGE